MNGESVENGEIDRETTGHRSGKLRHKVLATTAVFVVATTYNRK